MVVEVDSLDAAMSLDWMEVGGERSMDERDVASGLEGVSSWVVIVICMCVCVWCVVWVWCVGSVVRWWYVVMVMNGNGLNEDEDEYMIYILALSRSRSRSCSLARRVAIN